MKRAGITICHISVNLAFKKFEKSLHHYHTSEAAEEFNQAITGMLWHPGHWKLIKNKILSDSYALSKNTLFDAEFIAVFIKTKTSKNQRLLAEK